MMGKICLLSFLLLSKIAFGQQTAISVSLDQFAATSSLLDAALNSINSINSLIKKENYRNKITSFNNPATSDIGFNLQSEISAALVPILNKTRNTNKTKFSQLITSIIYNPIKSEQGGIFNTSSLFNTLVSVISSLAVNEKRVTSADIDSFLVTTGKYFTQYARLREANTHFDENIKKFNVRLLELQFDIREFILDLICILNTKFLRQELKAITLEELLLKYFDKQLLAGKSEDSAHEKKFPGDGIKTAKEIVYDIQKLFNEYQKIYAQNYKDIRAVLLQTKQLGGNINERQVDQVIREFDALYAESREADVVNLRLATLTERLNNLSLLEYSKR